MNTIWHRLVVRISTLNLKFFVFKLLSILILSFQISIKVEAIEKNSLESLVATQQYQKIISLLEPKVEKLNKEELVYLAQAYSQIKNHHSAVKSYQAASSLDSNDSQILAALGGELFLIGKDKEALLNLKEALNKNNKTTLAYKILIQYYENKKNKYELRLLYEDMLSNIGENEETISNLCRLCTNDRLYDLSQKYCERGIKLNPKSSDNYVNLGLTFKYMGEDEKAEEQLKKVTNLFPKSYFAQLTTAQFYEDKKKTLIAYSYYKKAHEINLKSIDAINGLILMATDLDKYDEALTLFEKNCSNNKSVIIAMRKAITLMRNQKTNSKANSYLTRFENKLSFCDRY